MRAYAMSCFTSDSIIEYGNDSGESLLVASMVLTCEHMQ
jgi:hypothetical protein